MQERTGLYTAGGKPQTLLGPALKPGDKAPEFTLLANDFQPVRLSDYKGKRVVLSVVPSLDTSVCSRQTHRFNTEAEKLGPDVPVLTISVDLPFTQARWCGAEGVKNVRTLSDHRDASFGQAYGLLVKETRLLARAVLIVDREGMLRHVQLVREMANEPDYGAVLAALAQVP